MRVAITGNDAAALAMKQINPDVVAAYPITPQTQIVQTFSQYVHNGEVDTVFVTVESEHSAMSAVVGAAASGARTMTATSANGLALMWEILYIAASLRLPIVMTVVNRALSAPINIHCDHSDSMGARDSGWIQIYSESAQETYDNLIQAVRIAEEARFPVMVCQDGFITSHSVEVLDVLEDKEVREFIGEYKPAYSILDVDNPITVGPLDLFDYYFEHKAQQIVDMPKAKDVVLKIGEEFGKKFGRKYGLFEAYMTDDAEVVVVVMNSAAGTTKAVIDELRSKGEKVGLLKPRLFRPFPAAEIAEILKGKKVAVLDRAMSFGAQAGPLSIEIQSALYLAGATASDTPVSSFIYGLGGRDITTDNIKHAIDVAKEGRHGHFEMLNVRE